MKFTNGERLSLLLVEDSPADVFLVNHAIQQEGLNVQLQVAEDGEAAIAIIDKVDSEQQVPPPDVMLLDLNVPRRSGNEVLERLRRSPRCQNVPVVMISSSDSPLERKRAFELGATEYFRKPSTLPEFMKLGAVVREVHSRRLAS